MIQVFVYGTLKPGEAYYDQFCGGYQISCIPALTRGKLYSLPVGYPAMADGEDWVQGVLLSFDAPSLLEALDELEDYQRDRAPENNEYQREKRPVCTMNHQPLAQAWMYLMTSVRVQQMGGQYLASGYWTGRDTNFNE
ncbi:MAG: gamma-glutamylcyclotransferase family protein [Cyanobacteria bacterium P01_A01_bin.123]